MKAEEVEGKHLQTLNAKRISIKINYERVLGTATPQRERRCPRRVCKRYPKALSSIFGRAIAIVIKREKERQMTDFVRSPALHAGEIRLPGCV